MTPFISVSRGWSAQRSGGANVTDLLLGVSDRCRYLSFPERYLRLISFRATVADHEENTTSSRRQFKYSSKKKESSQTEAGGKKAIKGRHTVDTVHFWHKLWEMSSKRSPAVKTYRQRCWYKHLSNISRLYRVGLQSHYKQCNSNLRDNHCKQKIIK